MINTVTISSAYNYRDYVSHIKQLLSTGKTTSINSSPEYLDYSKINLQRMLRLDKTVIITENIKTSLQQLKNQYIWLVITEGWCGDASQSVPLFNSISELCPKIKLKIILRDEAHEIMNSYLTNGSRSIPKLICLEENTLKERFNWGPRPHELQNLALKLKAENISKSEKGILIQKWYNEDKTNSIQLELHGLINKFLS